MRISAVVALSALALADARTLISGSNFPTRIMPQRWSPKVSAAYVGQALDGTFRVDKDHENQARMVIDELHRISDYLRAEHEYHGDARVGAHIAQERIEHAIKHLEEDIERLGDESSAAVDDAAASVYSDLW